MLTSTLVALAASFSLASAQSQKGFNYGATHTDNSPVTESQFQDDFTTAQNLVGASGFSSARLYTMIQAGTTNTPTEAIQAAINTKTSLLLGLWGSGGQTGLDNEIAALKSAISTYGTAFTDLINGISVGSEDLYRISPTGIENLSGIGAGPDEISSYIGQVKAAISGTAAGSKLVGHVDTWTAWVNGSNQAVIDASDFIGMDAYPYFQNTMSNAIGNGYNLFFDAYDATVAAVGSKPVWVTETGWPVSGKTENLAVPGLDNAKTYWDQVGCGRLFGRVNTYWYTLQDSAPTTPNPSFGIVGNPLSNTPLYDLSCSGTTSSTAKQDPSSVSAAIQQATSGSAQAGNVADNEKIGSGAGTTPQVSSQGANVVATQAPSPNGSPVPAQTSAAAQGSSAGSPAPVAQPAGGDKQPQPAPTTLITQTSVLPAATAATASASSCPASLSGNFEYPHLIVPVNKDSPDTASGTSYNGTISAAVSSIFNFDIPTSDNGKTCALVFLFPKQDQLTTSAFSQSGSGGLDVARLSSPATQSTTYNNQPSVSKDLGGPDSLTPGNEYVIASGDCFAGQTVSYKLSATGGLDLNYFQDYNKSPIGLYITVC